MKSRSAVAIAVVAAASLVLMPVDVAAQKRQRDRITRDEILSSPQRDLDLYQVIRALRPHFLRRPSEVRTLGGARPPQPLAIYVDGVREMGAEALRTITASRVEEVRYLDPTTSESEFGPRANGGALILKLYKPRNDARPGRDLTPAR
jgi:hypothetical protein